MVTGILFLLLFIKLAATEYRPGLLLSWINCLLAVNFLIGFLPGADAVGQTLAE